MTTRSLRTPKVFGFLALVAIAALFVFPILGSMNSATASPPVAALQQAGKPTPTPTPTGPCVGSWPMKSAAEADHTNNRWFYEGIAEIKSAVTPEEATKAAGVFVEKIKEFPHLLAGASKVILGEDVDKATLVNKDGCATDKAVEIHTELGLALATAKSITANEAPTDAWNTGVQNENVVGSSFQGIDGDRKAIQVVLKDGRTIWILARCGNIATPGKPPVPEGPTDQPPPPPPPTCPPGTVGTPPDCIAPKNPSEDPGPRGNAPEGHGPNDDPGPGEYIPPGDMERPPDTPRVDPPPPPPAPPEPPKQPTQPTKPVPTKDPAPPPPPEPEAPKPEAPETGCIVIPNIEDCK